MPGLQDLMGGLLQGAGGPAPTPPNAGGPEAGLKVLAEMQQQPPPGGEEQMLAEASNLIGQAASRMSMRSAKAGKALADALSKIQQAREAMKDVASGPLAPPPDLAMNGMAPGGLPGGMPPAMPQAA